MKWILFEYLPFQPSSLCFSWLVLKNYTIACIHFKQVHTVVAFLTENQVPDSLLLNLGDMYFMYTLYTVLYSQFAVCMIYTMFISCTIVRTILAYTVQYIVQCTVHYTLFSYNVRRILTGSGSDFLTSGYNSTFFQF